MPLSTLIPVVAQAPSDRAAVTISLIALLVAAVSATASVWSVRTARRSERRSHYDLVLDASVFAVSLGDWDEFPREVDFAIELRNRGRAPVQVDAIFVDVMRRRKRLHREYLAPGRTWDDADDLNLPHPLAGLTSKKWIVEEIVFRDQLVRRARLVLRVRLGPGEILSSEPMRPDWLDDPHFQRHLQEPAHP